MRERVKQNRVGRAGQVLPWALSLAVHGTLALLAVLLIRYAPLGTTDGPAPTQISVSLTPAPTPAPAAPPRAIKTPRKPQIARPRPRPVQPPPKPAQLAEPQAPTHQEAPSHEELSSAPAEAASAREPAASESPAAEPAPALQPMGGVSAPARLLAEGARPGEMPKPPYPAWAREKGVEGRIELELEVLPTGRVGKITVTQSTGSEALDHYTVKWAHDTLRFEPARLYGVPIKTHFRLAYSYGLVEG